MTEDEGKCKKKSIQISSLWRLAEGKRVGHPGRELSIMTYTGRLHPGRVFFSGFRKKKGWEFLWLNYMKR